MRQGYTNKSIKIHFFPQRLKWLIHGYKKSDVQKCSMFI